MRKMNKIVVTTAGLLAFLGAGPAAADAIERNLPPAQQQQGPATVVPPNAVPQALDVVPLGPDFKAIVILGPKDAVVKSANLAGVDASRVADLADADSQAQLSTYIGKPMTRRAIAEVEATIANIYRAKGLPFVAVMTPPQEVTMGIVQFRVIEFKVGKVEATGNTRGDASFYTDRVRVKSGDRVETGPLVQDLDWINRSNFHKAEAVFTPGTQSGETDLNLRVTEGKPWRVYAGYANSGAPSTTRDRFFAGGMAGDFLIPDSFLSYQITGSRDFWYDQGQFFNNARHPSYISHAMRLALPLAPRQQLEVTFSAVQTAKNVSPFDIRQRTIEGTVAYRSAMSNFSSMSGDIYAGVEAVHQNSDTYFLGFHALSQMVDVYQLFLGWSGGFTSPLGATLIDASLHASPGGIGSHNSSADFLSYSAGRVQNARYDYIQTSINHSFVIAPGFSVSSEVQGQLASGALPEARQISISNVRGYTSDDGSFDVGVTARNELRLPAFSALGSFSDIQDRVSPYVFADAAYVRDRFDRSSASPISAGLGLGYSLGGNLSSSLEAAYAIRDAGLTQRGDWQVGTRITLTY